MERGFPIGQYERKTVVIELFRQISATLEESTPTSLAGGNPAKDTPGVPIEGPRGFPPSMKPLQTSPSLGNSDVPSQLSHTGTNTVVSGSPRPEHTQDNGTFGNPRAFVNPRTAPKPLLKAHGMQISPLEPPNHDPKVGLWNNNLRVIPCGTDHSKVLWQDETFTSCLVCGFTRWHSLMLHARSLPIATFEVALVSLQSSVRVDFAGNYPAHFLMSAGVGLGYFSLLFQFETDFDLDQNAFGQSPLHVLNPQDLEEELISFLEWCKPRKHPPGLLLTQRDIYGRTPIHTLIQYPLPVDLFRKILTVCPFVEHQLRCRDTSGQTIIMLMNKASLKLKSRSLSDYAKLQTCITEVKIFLSELENGKDTTSQRYGFQDIARGARGTSYLSYFQCRICHQINAHGNSYREQMVCACVFRRDRNAPDETGLTPAHALVTYARCNGDGIPETASQTAELFRILIPRGDPTLREALHVLSPYGESLVYNAAVRGFDELLSYVLELEIPERRRAMVNACIEEQNRQRSVLQAVDDKIKELVMQVKICEASRVANGELRKELVENYNRTVAVRHILLSNGAQFKPNVTTRWQICREESSQQNDSGQQLSTPKSDSGRGGSILNSDLSYDLSILDGESTYGTSTPVKESDLEPSIQESDSIYMASTLKNKSKHETVLQERASANEDILQDSSPCYGPSAQDSDSGYGASFQESISGYGHSIRESDSGCGSSIRDDTGAVAIQPAVGSHLQTNKESDKDGSQSCCGKQDIDIMSETPQTLESHKSRLDDLRSVISDLDEINSQAPTRRSPQEMLAEEHLAVLLAQHHDLQPLFRDALKVVDEERFVHNMRRLLKRFYMDLSQQAKTNLEHATIQLLRSRWSRIRLAQMIVEQLSPQKQEHTTRQISEIQLRVQDLEDWIASNAGLSSHLDNSLDINVPSPVGEVLEEEDTDEDSDVETEFEQPKPLPNIDEMESFLLCGNSFRNLSASICLFLLPASLASLTRVLMSIPHDHVWFSDEEDSSLMNKLKTIIEDATEENWNWWPLRPRMKTLQKEQTRVHWICVSITTSLRLGADISSIAERICGLNCPKNMLKCTKCFFRIVRIARSIIIYADRESLTM
jgi:hypothetical protein